jgi:hypothetical protein
MNDTELTSRVRESVANVHTATPAEQIISRGRAVRARRRINGAAGTLAAAAGITLVVAGLLPSSNQPAAQLAAWTVAKQANGDVYVTIHELHDPAGLQSRLRADGVPASVSIAPNPSCQPYPLSGTPEQRRGVLGGVFQNADRSTFVIHPAALPSGSGIAITDKLLTSERGFTVSLAQASQQCTGT